MNQLSGNQLSGRAFRKMHGLGNDFIVLDGRTTPVVLDDARARALADRHRGIGCDQIIVLERPTDARADIAVSFINSDGGAVSSCGNGSRCVGWLAMGESGRDRAVIQTPAGLVEARTAKDGLISVDMGPARLEWRDIPLAREMDTLHLPLALEGLSDPVGVSMGNPHAVFFVADPDAVDLARLGPVLEHDPLFPERANIEMVTVVAPGRIRMRVWERGAGITQACGTGACAVLVAAVRRRLIERSAEIVLDGGSLHIEWRADNHVIMTGPVAETFVGTLSPTLLA